MFASDDEADRAISMLDRVGEGEVHWRGSSGGGGEEEEKQERERDILTLIGTRDQDRKQKIRID